MNFDKWFYEQKKWLQIVLLILPFVGWVMEILIRLSAYLRDKDTMKLVAFIVFVVFGGFWVLAVADLVYFIIKGHLFLA